MLRLLALALAAAPAAAKTCGMQPAYQLGGASTSCCTTAQQSAAAGCAPLAAAAAGPVDTAFAFSGSAAESYDGLAATVGAGSLGFTADAFGNANAALAVGSGARLAASGAALTAALPAPGAAASVSAFVKCAPTAATTSTVVQWANPTSPSST